MIQNGFHRYLKYDLRSFGVPSRLLYRSDVYLRHFVYLRTSDKAPVSPSAVTEIIVSQTDQVFSV